jgi:chemotaxis protein MotA
MFCGSILVLFSPLLYHDVTKRVAHRNEFLNRNALLMSFASLLGVFSGFGLIIAAIVIATPNWSIYFSAASLLMVLGGTIAAAFMSYHAKSVLTAFAGILGMFNKLRATHEGLNVEILRLIKWSYLVQQKGVLALEDEIRGVKANDPLIRYCLELVITNHEPDALRDMMQTAVEAEFERQTIPVQVLKSMASNAPAFGMLGTLVGLIAVLGSLGSDPETLMEVIGPGMALALITTLYGVFFARLIFLPAAHKMQEKEEIERFRHLMIVEGLCMLADKQTPRFMQDRLNSFLHPSNHFDIDKQIRNAA